MTEIATFDPPFDREAVLTSLKRDGAVILRDAIDSALCAKVAAELRPHFDREGDRSMSDFNGYQTLRLASVLARSPASAPLFTHDLTIAMADACLKENCLNYRIGSSTAIEIWPGESKQLLHRDAHCYHMEIPGIELQISALWALTDFTQENGPTQLVPGSHLWAAGRKPRPEDPVAEAVMPAGSLLLYLGNTWHGGGANQSKEPRMALVNTYSLGWLRQEENMYLSIPRAVADGLPDDLRRLIGYQHHGLVGWFPDDQDEWNENDFMDPVVIAPARQHKPAAE